MVGDAALAGERDGYGFLGLILVQLVEDQRVERVHAVVRRRWGGCGAGRGTLVGGDQKRPFSVGSTSHERLSGSRSGRASYRSNPRELACQPPVPTRSAERAER